MRRAFYFNCEPFCPVTPPIYPLTGQPAVAVRWERQLSVRAGLEAAGLSGGRLPPCDRTAHWFSDLNSKSVLLFHYCWLFGGVQVDLFCWSFSFTLLINRHICPLACHGFIFSVLLLHILIFWWPFFGWKPVLAFEFHYVWKMLLDFNVSSPAIKPTSQSQTAVSWLCVAFVLLLFILFLPFI